MLDGLFDMTQPCASNYPTDAAASPVPFVSQRQKLLSSGIQTLSSCLVMANLNEGIPFCFETKSMRIDILSYLAKIDEQFCQFERDERIVELSERLVGKQGSNSVMIC